jgi:AAA15 family ATPase/GTPase
MLIRFTVENFLSFSTRQEFSMLAGKKTLKPEHKNTRIKGRTTLKGAVMYGANASGKSNFVKALKYGRDLLIQSKQGIPSYQNFRLQEEYAQKPTRMEFEQQHKGKNYAYGFIFNKEQILEEWLYEITLKKEIEIFTRIAGGKFSITPLLEKNKDEEQSRFLQFTAKATPKNKLFLSEVYLRNISENVSDVEDLLNVIDWFRNSLKIIFPDEKYNGALLFEKEQNEKLLETYQRFLDYFDTGISKVLLEEVDEKQVNLPQGLLDKITADLLDDTSENVRALVERDKHDLISIVKKGNELSYQKFFTQRIDMTTGKDVVFEMHEESDGTNKIMDFIPIMLDLIKGDNTFVIDEMERSLHPNLIYDFFKLYFELSGEKESQLIIASHESTLLNQDLLRQDEIWFAHKNALGATELNSLEEYSIRFDKKIQKDYLQGRFKAVPRLGDPSQLLAEIP